MRGQRVGKVTISIPKTLLDFADQLASERSTSRSEVIAELLKKAEKELIEAEMAEGYREMAEENRREAKEWLALTSEVMLRDD